uniref:RxLR effector candidate protein n=1 Tax=Hyaloperonospora arabidopsidis (strain Emoy2) TaxID=559515 RepID=M4BBW9_HYAAE
MPPLGCSLPMFCEKSGTSSQGANLQSRFKCAERSFSDRPSSATGVSCHTARQGLRHPPSVESEAPNYPPEADSYVTGRGNSSDVLLHRGGSTCVPQGSIGHRAQPDLEHERNMRMTLVDIVNRFRSERENDRSDFAFAQLGNERKQRSLCDKLVEDSQDIFKLRGEISELQTRDESQHRDYKYLLEMLERKGFLHRKKPVLVVWPKTAWQFNRICVA